MKYHNKLFKCLLFVIIFSISSSAQFLNPSFESWDDQGNPVSWITGNVPSLAIPITQSTDAQEGSFSVKIEILEYAGGYYSGALQSLGGSSAYGHEISMDYSSVNGYFKFLQSGSAILSFIAIVYDASTFPIGGGELNVNQSTSNWTQFNVPIEYTGENGASIIFSVSMYDTSDTGFDPNTLSAFALIDNVSLGNPTTISKDVHIPTEYRLNQNYPNPFNPSTKIEYSLPISGNIELALHDIMGNKIAIIENTYKAAGTHTLTLDASPFSSGIYFYTLKAGSFMESKKMLFLK